MTTNDPIQGLIDYVNEIKPFHTKILEVAVAYAQNDDVDITITEEFNIDVSLFWPALADEDDVPIRNCPEGWGVEWDRQSQYIVIDASISPQTVTLNGDQSAFFTDGTRFEIREPTTDTGTVSTSVDTVNIVSVNAAPGSAERIITSPDGFNWTVQSTPVANTVEHTGVDYSPTLLRFVICTNTRTVITSDDSGSTWDEQADAIPDAGNVNQWNGIKWISELGMFFVANQDDFGSKIAYSSDGISWTLVPQTQTPLIGALVTELVKFQYITSISKVVLYAGASANFHMAYSDDGVTWKDVLCHTGNATPKTGSTVSTTEWSSKFDWILSIESSNGNNNGPVFKRYTIGAGSPLFAAADWTNLGFSTQVPPVSYHGHYTDLTWITAGSPELYLLSGQGNDGGGTLLGSPVSSGSNLLTSEDGVTWNRVGGIEPIIDSTARQPFIWNEVNYIPTLDRILMTASSVVENGGGSPSTYIMRISDPVLGKSSNYNAGSSRWTKVDVPVLGSPSTQILRFGTFAAGETTATTTIPEQTPRVYEMLALSSDYDETLNKTILGAVETGFDFLGSPIFFGSPLILGSPQFPLPGSPPFSGSEFFFPPYPEGSISNGDVFIIHDVVSTTKLNIVTRPSPFYGSPPAGPGYTGGSPFQVGSPLPGSPKRVVGSPATYSSDVNVAGNTITFKGITTEPFNYGREVSIRNALEPSLNKTYNVLNAVDLGGSPELIQITVLDTIHADTTNDGELVLTPDGYSGGSYCSDVPPEWGQTHWMEDLNMDWRFESPAVPTLENFVVVNAAVSSNDDRIFTSQDGITWDRQQHAIDDNHDNITYCPTLRRFVIVHNTRNVSYSDDGGVTWVLQTDAFPVSAGGAPNYLWLYIDWIDELGMFLAGNGSTDTDEEKIAYSTDGLTWTLVDTPTQWAAHPQAPITSDFVYVGSMGVVIALAYSNNNAPNSSNIVWSSDGINWTYVADALNPSNSFDVLAATKQGLVWSETHDKLMGVKGTGSNSTTVRVREYDTSAAGSPIFASGTWTDRTINPPWGLNGNFETGIYAGGSINKFIFVGQGTDNSSGSPDSDKYNMLTSSDGISWEGFTLGPRTTGGTGTFLQGVAYSSALDRVTAFSYTINGVGSPLTSSNAWYSDDGSTWTSSTTLGTGLQFKSAIAGQSSSGSGLLEPAFQYFILSADSTANTISVQGDVRAIGEQFGSPAGGSPISIPATIQHAAGSPSSPTNNSDVVISDITYDVSTNYSTLQLDIVSVNTPSGWIISR